MIHCDNFNENVCAYIDNELNIEERLSFEEHAKNCRSCKRELDEMTQIVHLCTSLPQQELPEDFKAELHEKLVAVAGRTEKSDRSPALTETEERFKGSGVKEREGKVMPFRKTKGFLVVRAFAAVAAGVLVILLAGVWFRFGWFSPSKMESGNSTALAAKEEPAQARDESVAENFAAAPEAAIAGESGGQARTFGAAAVAPVESAEVDRSAKVQNRDIAAAETASGTETVKSKTATITLTADDPDREWDKVKLLVEQNSGEIIDLPSLVSFSEKTAVSVELADNQEASVLKSGSLTAPDQRNASVAATSEESETKANESVTNGAEPASAKGSETAIMAAGNESGAVTKLLVFMIPDTQYDKFVAKLYVQFGAANVQPGALVTEDTTDALAGSIAESEALDGQIQELQKKDAGKKSADLEELRARKETIDKQIDELRLRNDLVVVTVCINGK